MYSYVMPLEELKKRSVMFWLPGGGRDNGVWADTWVLLAELEEDDAATVMDSLAEAGVGGYTVAVRGPRNGPDGKHRLYVDTQRYHRAEELLMVSMRCRGNRS